EVAERKQSERMRGREIERKLQVDEPEILAPAPSKRGTEPVEHLGGARLRRVNHQGELLAGGELVGRLDDQRMVRQSFVERGENLQRVGVVSLPREKTSIALHHAQRGRIELVGALEALGGLLLLAGEVEDQRGMRLLEDGIPIRAGELVDGVGR